MQVRRLRLQNLQFLFHTRIIGSNLGCITFEITDNAAQVLDQAYDDAEACSVGGQEVDVKTKLNESKLFAQHVEYQPVNHRLSSIVHKYSSVMASRSDREKKVDGVKYVPQVSLKTEISDFAKARGKVMQKAENRKKGLQSLGVELEQTLKAVDWTRLASIYDEASDLGSDDW